MLSPSVEGWIRPIAELDDRVFADHRARAAGRPCEPARLGLFAPVTVDGGACDIYPQWAGTWPTEDKYRRLPRRPSQEQKGLDERARMASQRPSPCDPQKLYHRAQR